MPSRTTSQLDRGRRVRPATESLEDRAVPAVYLAAAPLATFAGTAGPVQLGMALDFGPAATSLAGARVAISWGDGSAPTLGTLGQSTMTPPGGASPATTPGVVETTPVLGIHAFPGSGTYPVTFNVVTPDGRSLYVSTTATVSANPAGGSGFAVYGAGGEALTSVPLAKFLTPIGTSVPSTALIDWGDGTTSSYGSVVASPYPGNADAVVVTGSHTYASPGAYVAVVNMQTTPYGVGDTVNGASYDLGSSAGIASTKVDVTSILDTPGSAIAGPVVPTTLNLANRLATQG